MPDLHRSLVNFRAALDDIRRAYPAEDDAEALRDTALGETTLEDDLSEYCDGPKRDRLRTVLARIKGEPHA